MSSERKWIPFHDQLPTEADTDWRGAIMVSGPCGISTMPLSRAVSGDRKASQYTHWMPTFMVKPPESIQIGDWVKYVGPDENDYGLLNGVRLRVRHIETHGIDYVFWTFTPDSLKGEYPVGLRFDPRDLAPAEKLTNAT